MSSASDFVIESGILKQYVGPGGDVIIPEGVTSIGDHAFAWRKTVTSVTIPDSVTSIGWYAFSDCSILTTISLPASVKTVGEHAFEGCSSLVSVEVNNPKCAFGNRVFGDSLPKGLQASTEQLLPLFSVADVASFVFEADEWKHLSTEAKIYLFLTKQGRTLEKHYKNAISEPLAAAIGEAILKLLSDDPSVKDCEQVYTFFTLLEDKVDPQQARRLYEQLKTLKTGAKTAARIEAEPMMMEMVGCSSEIDESLSPAEKLVMTWQMAEKQTAAELLEQLREMSAMKPSELPPLLDVEGKSCAPFVLAWLLTAHDEIRYVSGSYVEVRPVTPGSDLRPEARELLSLLDESSIQKALLSLAEQIAGTGGINKKANLLYAICRYASEKTMGSVCSKAKKMSRHSQAVFSGAICCSDTRAAILYADKIKRLDAYASMRNTDANTLRDKVLADFGLDEKGRRTMDLGSRTLTIRLQPDLSLVLIDDKTGKEVKSVPKKDADPEKYKQIKKAVDDMKSSVKKVAKGRADHILKAFLTGNETAATAWKDTYLGNPVFRSVAELVVWAQGDSTFILAKNGAIDSAEQPYTITDESIRVAHPMEMKAADVVAWQKYFTIHGLKQPFAQVWESVRDASEIRKDRYVDSMIPYYRFLNQGKHGISVEDYDYHNEICISLDGCETEIERIDWRRHEINPNDRFEIKSFSFKQYTRQVNHIVAYLDRITVWDRVRNDDLGVMDLMDSFTLAQITEFIAAAQEANANNVLAALLDYKNTHFADFDPMAEFTLEW